MKLEYMSEETILEQAKELEKIHEGALLESHLIEDYEKAKELLVKAEEGCGKLYKIKNEFHKIECWKPDICSGCKEAIEILRRIIG